MAYTYKKLCDVEMVDTAIEPNILIEDGGDIKKISADNIAVPQVQANWAEEDETSAAFILNKPDLSQVGGNGGANVITYSLASSTLFLDGAPVTRQSVVDNWNNGSILRIQDTYYNDPSVSGNFGSIVGIYYEMISGGTVTSAKIQYTLASGVATFGTLDI